MRAFYYSSTVKSILPPVDPSRPAQVSWLGVVVLVMSAGFFYQTGSFLQLYFRYPSATDLAFTYPDSVPFPSISFCNHNAYMKSKVCLQEPSICFLSLRGQELCDQDPDLCRNTTFMIQYMIPRVDKLDFELPMNLQDVEKFIHGPEIIRDCYASWAPDFDFCRQEHLEYQVIQDIFELRRACYIVNSQILKPPTPISNMPTYSSESSPHYLTFLLDVAPHEYFQPYRIPRAYIALLSPYAITNPYRGGINAEPGKQYRFKIRPSMTLLLPAPYKSNCTDYLGQRRSQNDPVNQENCAGKCIFQKSIQACSCLPIQIPQPTEDWFNRSLEFCRLHGLDSDHCTSTLNISECFKKCNKECSYLSYDYKVEEELFHANLPSTRLADPRFNQSTLGITPEMLDGFVIGETLRRPPYSNWFSEHQYIKVIVELDKAELQVFKEIPKYASIELFSYIGGYLGMWLGICLVMAFDFLELAGLFMLRLFRGSSRPSTSALYQN